MAASSNRPKDQFFARSYSVKAISCMKVCKVFGPNRTKVFHVKRFGTIGAPNRTILTNLLLSFS